MSESQAGSRYFAGRFPRNLLPLVLAVVPLLYFYPATLGWQVISPDDGVIFNVPLRAVAARIVWEGHLPLWNPFIFSGMPLHASAQAGLLFPLNWFYLFFSTPAATNLMMLASYGLAGVGAYLYARRSGSSLGGALLTGLAWQCSAFLIDQIGHTNILQTAAFLPLTLWAVDGYGDTGSRWRGVLLACLVGMQACIGHQQTFVYSLLLLECYALMLALTEPARRWRYVGAMVLGAIGVAVAAAQLVPTWELLQNSPRSDASFDFFTSFSLPRRFLLTLLVPYLLGGGSGPVFSAPYVGVSFYGEYGLYVGQLTLMLAGCAVFLRGDARTRFWLVVAIVGLLLALGRYAPLQLYRFIYHLPVLNMFRVPARHIMEVQFALVVLAGRGVTALVQARGSRVAVRAAVIAASLVMATMLVIVTWLRHPLFRLAGEAPVTFLRTPELFVPVCVAIVASVALLAFARRPRGATFSVVILLLAADLVLWGHSSGWRQGSFGSGFEFWSQPATVTFLEQRKAADPDPFRIVTEERMFDPALPVAPPPPGSRWIPALQADMHMPFGIENAAGYDGFGLSRYSKFAGDMKVWGELPDPDRVFRGTGREMDLLNVRYLLARPMADTPPSSSERWRFVDRVGAVNVFENQHRLPRAWLASEARVMPQRQILQAVRTGLLPGSTTPWDPRTTALVESAVGLSGTIAADPMARADVTNADPSRLSVRTSSSVPSVLVVAEHDFPGWRVRVDGASAQIVRVDYDLRGVALSPGTHQVDFFYRPAMVTAGVTITVVTFMLLIIWARRDSTTVALETARV